MSSREIRVPEEVYEALRDSRRSGESVEDVVRRLVAERRAHPLYDIVGILDESEEESVREASRRVRSDLDDRVQEDS